MTSITSVYRWVKLTAQQPSRGLVHQGCSLGAEWKEQFTIDFVCVCVCMCVYVSMSVWLVSAFPLMWHIKRSMGVHCTACLNAAAVLRLSSIVIDWWFLLSPHLPVHLASKSTLGSDFYQYFLLTFFPLSLSLSLSLINYFCTLIHATCKVALLLQLLHFIAAPIFRSLLSLLPWNNLQWNYMCHSQACSL